MARGLAAQEQPADEGPPHCLARNSVVCVAAWQQLAGWHLTQLNSCHLCVVCVAAHRVATTGLLALLCTTYPDFHIVFIALIALDIFSHWFQMYQTLLAGSSTHKVREGGRRVVLGWQPKQLTLGGLGVSLLNGVCWGGGPSS